jgi:hypothetical protein
MALEVKIAKNSKLPKLPENCFELVGKCGWPSISTWIMFLQHHQHIILSTHIVERMVPSSKLDLDMSMKAVVTVLMTSHLRV